MCFFRMRKLQSIIEDLPYLDLDTRDLFHAREVRVSDRVINPIPCGPPLSYDGL